MNDHAPWCAWLYDQRMWNEHGKLPIIEHACNCPAKSEWEKNDPMRITDEVHPQPTRTEVKVVQRHCLACGRSEESATGQPIYYSPGRLPHHNRCDRCGARALVADEVQTIVTRTDAYDWRAEQPRRGRPPRSLVLLREQQRQEHAEASLL